MDETARLLERMACAELNHIAASGSGIPADWLPAERVVWSCYEWTPSGLLARVIRHLAERHDRHLSMCGPARFITAAQAQEWGWPVYRVPEPEPDEPAVIAPR